MDTLERYLSKRSSDGDTSDAPLLSPGDVLGSWHIRALIARGGSGEVYRAQNSCGSLEAAVKVLHKTTPASRRRFERERDLLAANESGAFPRLFENDTDAEHPWYAMELLSAVEPPRSDKAAADYLLKVCACVSALHRLGYVHRDIKPGNIMRRKNGSLVLIDLGLVKKLPRSNTLTSEQLSLVDDRVVGVGTLGYAAPEQMIGDTITPASDIHALGVLIDACFRGRLPRAWRAIALRATASIPAYRFATVEDLARAIRLRHLGRWLIALGLPLVAALAFLAVALHNRAMSRAATDAASATEPAFRDEIELDGEHLTLDEPLHVPAGKKLRVRGPGLLEGEITGDAGATLVLEDATLLDTSRAPIAERKLHYLIRGDTTYINFVRLDEPTDLSAWTNHFASTALLPTAVVRFKGPFSRSDHRTMLDLKWFGSALYGPNAAEKLDRLTKEAKAACETRYP